MSLTGFNRRRRALVAQQRHTKRLEPTVELATEILGNNQKGSSLEEMTVKELRVLAKETGVVGYGNMSKVDIIMAIQEAENTLVGDHNA